MYEPLSELPKEAIGKEASLVEALFFLAQTLHFCNINLCVTSLIFHVTCAHPLMSFCCVPTSNCDFIRFYVYILHIMKWDKHKISKF